MKKGIALVLKGGGAKGLAYVGAIQELEEVCDFNLIVGTSVGAITAALLAAGYSGRELEGVLRRTPFDRFLDGGHKAWGNLLFRGFLHPGKKLQTWLEDLLRIKLGTDGDVTMGEIGKISDRRLIIVAAQEDAREHIYDSKGTNSDSKVGVAVKHSAAVPFFFQPVTNDETLGLDGGIVGNFPMKQALDSGANIPVIGIFLGRSEGAQRTISNLTFMRVLRALINILLVKDEHYWATGGDSRIHVMSIDCSAVGTLELRLRPNQYEYLLATGRAAAIRFILRNNSDIPLNESSLFEVQPQIASQLEKRLAEIEASAKQLGEGIKAFKTKRKLKFKIIAASCTLGLLSAVYFLMVEPANRSRTELTSTEIALSKFSQAWERDLFRDEGRISTEYNDPNTNAPTLETATTAQGDLNRSLAKWESFLLANYSVPHSLIDQPTVNLILPKSAVNVWELMGDLYYFRALYGVLVLEKPGKQVSTPGQFETALNDALRSLSYTRRSQAAWDSIVAVRPGRFPENPCDSLVGSTSVMALVNKTGVCFDPSSPLHPDLSNWPEPLVRSAEIGINEGPSRHTYTLNLRYFIAASYCILVRLKAFDKEQLSEKLGPDESQISPSVAWNLIDQATAACTSADIASNYGPDQDPSVAWFQHNFPRSGLMAQK